MCGIKIRKFTYKINELVVALLKLYITGKRIFWGALVFSQIPFRRLWTDYGLRRVDDGSVSKGMNDIRKM
jgi:hypothetical protein